ncbi:hypothetical protein Tco_1432265 [Tanacetum coccineum]
MIVATFIDESLHIPVINISKLAVVGQLGYDDEVENLHVACEDWGLFHVLIHQSFYESHAYLRYTVTDICKVKCYANNIHHLAALYIVFRGVFWDPNSRVAVTSGLGDHKRIARYNI